MEKLLWKDREEIRREVLYVEFWRMDMGFRQTENRSRFDA